MFFISFALTWFIGSQVLNWTFGGDGGGGVGGDCENRKMLYIPVTI